MNKDIRFISWAQEFEDLILFAALKDVENGFYIDVGANDPCAISVTKAFYDRGWHGINIEPLAYEYQMLCKERPRDININAGCGAESGTLKLYGDDSGATFVESVAVDGGFAVDPIEVPIRTLTDICEQNCDAAAPIHFCKIDVEGFERAVLEGLDFQKWRPWIVCMESAVPNTRVSCHEGWEDLLIQNNYRLAFVHGINRYYVDATTAAASLAFSGIDELLEDYTVYRPCLFHVISRSGKEKVTFNTLPRITIKQSVAWVIKIVLQLPKAVFHRFKVRLKK